MTIDEFFQNMKGYQDISKNPKYNWDNRPEAEMSLEDALEWVQLDDELQVHNEELEENVLKSKFE